MKKSQQHTGVFLCILILVASMLPALHAIEHLSLVSGEDQDQREIVEKFSNPAVDCDLCDFNLPSIDEPSVFSYHLHLHQNYNIQNISIAETFLLYQGTLFSLRAPPQSIS